MMLKSVKNSKHFIIVSIILLTIILFSGGCDDSGITPPPPVYTDPNVVVFRDVSAFFWEFALYDTTFAGINLLDGRGTRQDSTNKDIELTDSAGTFQDFYFRSGNLTSLLTGLKTRFKREYSTLNPAQFDTLSVIKDTDTLLTPSDFTEDSTAAWEYFNISQNRMPVYSFCLEGRYSGNNYIFGVFYVTGVQRVFSPEFLTYGVVVIIDIKLNKAGKNQFRDKWSVK